MSVTDDVLEAVADDDRLPITFRMDEHALSNDIDFLLPYFTSVLYRRLADEMQDKNVAHQSVIDYIRAKVTAPTHNRRF